MEMHTIYGHQMVKRQQAPAWPRKSFSTIASGTTARGYPARIYAATGEELPPLSGKTIPIFSRIATVVDVYDAATSQRCYSSAKLPVQVLRDAYVGKVFFDPVVEQAFY